MQPKVAAKGAVHPVKVVVAKSPAPNAVKVKGAPVAKVKAAVKPEQAPAAPKPEATVTENKPAPSAAAPTKEIHFEGKRDPFVSPVVAMGASGSGCSSGKRCLAIDQIALRGVVKSDAGMIAVVVNSVDKAYFLRENDPVFDGYVVKITGDSIVFKETFHDRLGKTLTRDVTKTITRPSA
jgi:Tfp pilus assembly protein PilP